MKLLTRFNLIFIVVFGLGLSVAVWLAYDFLRKDAKSRVLEQAKLMMQTTLATRDYTSEQIQPLLVKEQRHDAKFLAQTVPAYSAVEVFNYLHQRNPEYAYKEATLNPTNPRDRASDWEADVVNTFRNDKDKTDLVGERDTPTGKSLFFARPLRVSSPSCLECHSTPGVAPVSMIRQYGPDNGFGWQDNEIIGAQIVSVPESLPLQMADQALKTMIVYLAIIALVTLLILDTALVVTVIRPVGKLSEMADKISQGKLDVEELPVRGRDEISVLACSFNRMQRSLVRAMKMLESGKEGEDRG
jgi:HAMP domain-containing protein